MSILSVNTVKSLGTGAPVFQNSTGTEKGQLVKAWANFDGTFGTSPFTEANGGIRDSFNVSSITDVTTGVYTVNFTNAMANNNYVTVITKRLNETGGSTSSDDIGTGLVNTAQTTSAVNVFTRNTDCIAVNVAVFGD
tara:strand:+ start:3256 stop:3666 length:411 start_codon:yes stop_codon:yes gene_type:complete